MKKQSNPNLILNRSFSAYRALDAQLDQLNSVLDVLEERNDRIHGQMKDILNNAKKENDDNHDPDAGGSAPA